MKTIIFSNYDDLNNPYYAGGGAIAIHETAKRLSKRYHTTVITGRYPGSKNIVVDGVTYERIGISFGGPKIGQLAFQFVLPWYALKKAYDVWFESFTPPFSISILPLLPDRRIIGLVHMLSGKDMRRKYRLPFDVIEMFGLRFYQEIITTTDAIKDQVQKSSPDSRVYVVPNGVNPIRVLSRSKKTHILFIGRIEVNQKGLDLLLDAVKSLKDKGSYQLVIAGGGEKKQLDLLRSLIKSNELTKQVRLVGKVAGRKKQELFDRALAIVVSSRFETFSLTCLEAIASGVPLVTFAIAGLSWMPSKIRISVKPFSSEKLAEAILKAATNAEKRSELIRLGKAFAKQYSWDTIASSYTNIIEKKA